MPTYYLAKISGKLHKIKENWPRGGAQFHAIPGVILASDSDSDISLRFRFGHWRFNYRQCPMLMDTSDLIIASVQPGNAANIQTICYCFHPGI